jgi:RimJ/RimL family protein N-acetyltransferase
VATAPIETPRLRLERWSPASADVVVTLSRLPEMMRFIGTGGPWPRARAEAVASRALDHWQRHGFGWRLAVERETGRAVGFMGLNFTDDSTARLPAGEYEIGWWIEPQSQGQGLAKEGGAAIRDHALGDLGAPSVVARLRPANLASAGVAKALGLTFEFETTEDTTGGPVAVYRLPGAIG